MLLLQSQEEEEELSQVTGELEIMLVSVTHVACDGDCPIVMLYDNNNQDPPTVGQTEASNGQSSI